MNCKIVVIPPRCVLICLTLYLYYCVTPSLQIAGPFKLSINNEYVATFGNRYENPRGRWLLAKRLNNAGQYDKLRDICEKAFRRAGLGPIYVDVARVFIGFLKFREPEYKSMIVDVLVCEIEDTENKEGLKAQFFLTKGKTDDAVYFLYPLNLGRMKFIVLNDRHVTRVIDTYARKI